MGNFTSVPDVVTGQSFPPSLWESAIMNNLNLGVWRQLAEATLASSAATVSFASIPATFAHLRLSWSARDNANAAASAALQAQLNGNTAADYDIWGIGITGSTVAGRGSGGVSGGGTSFASATYAGSTADANKFSAGELIIFDYANTTHFKAVQLRGGGYYTATSQDVVVSFGHWKNLAAVNSILLTAANAFAAGSRFSLHGIPA